MTLGIFLVLTLANPLAVQSPTIPSELSILQGNSVIANHSVIPAVVHSLGVLSDLYWKDEEYTVQELREFVGEKSVIGCLIKYESGWRENAVGDNGRSFGLLQFHKATFDLYAKKYNLDLEYRNGSHQILLANLMLNDNFNNVKHWSVWKRCVY